MKIKLLNFWEQLRATYWFLPILMVALSFVLAAATITLDQTIPSQPAVFLAWIYAVGPEGTRIVLSTIAGSMITIAGVTFSIIIVALTLASSQFGPRLLANFMRDRGNQIVLGTFLATFMYCLLVLRAVSNAENGMFVPHISATLALFLAIASIGVLIYFIHHAAVSIQADNIIAAVGRELDEAITRLFPEKEQGWQLEQKLRREDDIPAMFEEEAYAVPARQTGYLQAIDYDGLMKLASKNNLLLRLQRRPGDFVASGSDLVLLWPADNANETFVATINDAHAMGVHRQRIQDIELAIDQLVEIAVRALSPGINDPFTAVACIERLGASFVRLVERSIPSGYLYDDDGRLRLITNAVTFAGLTHSAFSQIRQYGRSSVVVTIHLLETIAEIAAHTDNKRYRSVLLRQAVMIKRGSEEALVDESDHQDVLNRYELVRRAVEK
jgi:uncharacterized membrane protein